MTYPRKMMVELCIMLGCDYLKRIKWYWSTKSLKFIRTFNNINEIIDEIKKRIQILKKTILKNLIMLKEVYGI